MIRLSPSRTYSFCPDVSAEDARDVRFVLSALQRDATFVSLLNVADMNLAPGAYEAPLNWFRLGLLNAAAFFLLALACLFMRDIASAAILFTLTLTLQVAVMIHSALQERKVR